MITENDQRDNRKVYDKAAQDFRGKAPSLLTYKYLVRPSLERALDQSFPGDRANLKALDVGSASGRNVHTLVENGFRASNILGVEISPEQVAIARREIPDATFKVGDISTHELAPESNDLAIMVMVSEFLDGDKLPKALTSINSSLRPGGVFVNITTHPDRYKAKYGVDRGGAEVTTHGPWSDDKFSNYVWGVDEQRRALETAGFKVDTVEELRMPQDVDEEDRERLKGFTHVGELARLTFVAHKPDTGSKRT